MNVRPADIPHVLSSSSKIGTGNFYLLKSAGGFIFTACYAGLVDIFSNCTSDTARLVYRGDIMHKIYYLWITFPGNISPKERLISYTRAQFFQEPFLRF